MNETRPKEQEILHWLTRNWHLALIGLAIGAFVVDLIGPEILTKPFVCGRAENGKHIYITLPESSLGANWQEVWKTQPYKACEPQPGWDRCFYDGPHHMFKHQVERQRVFWSVVKEQIQLEDQTGRRIASDIWYYIRPTWLSTLLFPDYGEEILCRDMKERSLVPNYGLSFLDVIEEKK